MASPIQVEPNAPINGLKGVGPKLENTLSKLGIYRYIDLLLHLPYRYQDRTHVTPISEITSGEECLVAGQVVGCDLQFGKRRSLKVTLEEDGRRVSLRFFYFNKFQHEQLKKAAYLRAYGEFGYFGRELSCIHPDYEVLDSLNTKVTTDSLTPIYPTTQGLAQGRLRNLITTLCALPWPDVAGTPFSALKTLHRPPAGTSTQDLTTLQRDIAREELTAYYLVMKGRAQARLDSRAQALPQAQGLGRELLANLGFTLTRAQGRVITDVFNDLAANRPALRLVQGDVGSGKTVVAAFAAIRAAEHQAQSALMAPTELLAEQHYLNFKQWLEPLGVRVTLLTGSLPAKERRERLANIASGETDVAIGTHALFQDQVEFHRLALSIIDEQHRFGVHQRMALQLKGEHIEQPHQLIMTATPIPRTLTMTLYADMDVSIIDELPPGRQAITTHTVNQSRRDEILALADQSLSKGQQVYWVCTLIEASDEIDAVSANETHLWLKKALPHRRVGLLHGRMNSEEKVATMQAFSAGELDCLVATTVIEVGVDVPNATFMVIENAERLGLAQLHQLRGRVGRGQLASHCYLLFGERLSDAAKTRLKAMRDSQDGFYLAEQDLQIRGPGDVLGTRQAGEQSFRIADLNQHSDLMPAVIARGEVLLNAPTDSDDHHYMHALLNAWASGEYGPLSA